MKKIKGIPVHRMDNWFAGVYIKPFGARTPNGTGYEISGHHRHDFYYCVLLEQGNMELDVDFGNIRLGDHSLFLSYPGQIHRITAASLQSGWFLAIDPSVLDEPLRTILDQCLSEVVQAPLSADLCGQLRSIADNLYRVYRDESQLFREPVIRSLATALVYRLASVYLSAERMRLGAHPARSVEITKRFRQELRRHFRELKRPAEFAARLGITPTHLNDTVRSVTGFPLTYHIQQELMREARRLLAYSDLSVKEIAAELGFDDTRYFNRLFSKVAGSSPGAFRKLQLAARGIPAA